MASNAQNLIITAGLSRSTAVQSGDFVHHNPDFAFKTGLINGCGGRTHDSTKRPRHSFASPRRPKAGRLVPLFLGHLAAAHVDTNSHPGLIPQLSFITKAYKAFVGRSEVI